MTQRMIRGMATALVVLAVVGFVSWAHADGPDRGGGVNFNVSSPRHNWFQVPYSQVVQAVIFNPRESISYTTNAWVPEGGQMTEPAVTEHTWSSGALQFEGWSYYGPGRWEMRTTGLEKFQLVYFPPSRGLQYGEPAGAVIVYLVKCGVEFANLHAEGPGIVRQTNIGIVDQPDRYFGSVCGRIGQI